MYMRVWLARDWKRRTVGGLRACSHELSEILKPERCTLNSQP